MKCYDLNGKRLPVPSFFMISNLGGGGSDKYRGLVYADLYRNTPTLYNYYYLKYPNFATKWLKNINDYDTIGDFLAYTRISMIKDEGYVCAEHKQSKIDFSKTIHLLDSGAANIFNNFVLGKLAANCENTVLEKLYDEIPVYYDFANRYKFDIVVGFDLGGKYTFKGDERTDEGLLKIRNRLRNESTAINYVILEKSVEYLLKNQEFYPKVLATIHGDTPEDYKKYTQKVIELEEKSGYKFWGFALGGIASSKGINQSWFENYKPADGEKNCYLVSAAAKIVKNIVGDRPIHGLGCGGFGNIEEAYKNGLTSFDSQTPGRRAYDGNAAAAEHVFDAAHKDSFSQYLIGKLDLNKMEINQKLERKYIKLNVVKDDVELCGCNACKQIKTINEVKELYRRKVEGDKESYYFARQLLNAHAIWQHNFLFEKLQNK